MIGRVDLGMILAGLVGGLVLVLLVPKMRPEVTSSQAVRSGVVFAVTWIAVGVLLSAVGDIWVAIVVAGALAGAGAAIAYGRRSRA